MFRVIVCGSRNFNDYLHLEKVLDNLLQMQKEPIILSGGAKGADALAEAYARKRGYRIERHPARWKTEGRSAGMKRNLRMAERANGCVAFWDGESRGTKHMIDTCLKQDIPLRISNGGYFV